MWNCVFLLSLLLLFEVVTGASWTQRPADVSSPVGSTVTLTCRVSGEAGFVTWNKNGVTIAVGTRIISGDTNRISIPEDTKYNLVITSLQKSDDADYTCTVENISPESEKAVTVHLTVLILPGQPVISSNNTNSVKVENEVIVLTCLSKGGNPPPTFIWTKNGLVLNSNIVETKVPKGDSSSQLTVHLDYSDNLAVYMCSVHNSVNADNPFSVSYQFSVLYHPQIVFSPFRDLSVELGKPGSLLCNVSANPAVSSVSWTKDGQPLQTTNSLIEFSAATKANSGSYTCTTSNTINGQTKPATDTASINVIYPPVINIQSSYEVNESGVLDIVCNVEANPAAWYTRWQKTGGTMESIDNRLRIDNIKRSSKGNYTCISKNYIQPSGQTQRIEESIKYTYIHVRYPPGSSFISPVTPVYVGDRLEVSCSVSDPGYPSPTYEWRKLDTNQLMRTSQSNLVISGVTLQDNGNYSCTAKNIMGSGGPSVVEVQVYERPAFVGVHKDRDTIFSNKTAYMMQCQIRGRPMPRIQWLKDGNLLDVTGTMYTLKTTTQPADVYSYLVTSQIVLQGSNRDGTTNPLISDVANYTCKEVTANIEHTMALFIYFPPTISPHEKVPAVDGGTAQLKCVGEGYPVPSFTWRRNNAILSSSGRLIIHPPKFISVTKSESVLQIDRITGQDYGDYTCQIANQYGQTTKTLTLAVKSKPEAPKDLIWLKKSWDQITLHWMAGFDGGSQQYFMIRYRTNPPNSIEKTVAVQPDNVTSFVVTNLIPSTTYIFQVYGQNQLGVGALSESITVSTDSYTFPVIGGELEYSDQSKQLELNLNVNNTYCVKIKLSTNGGSSWQTYAEGVLDCFDANAARIAVTTRGVNRMNVSLCLVLRKDVCSVPVSVRINMSSTPDLTETEVIIIGCVCAAILIALLIVLVCIIIRRRKLAKQLPPPTSTNLAANGHQPPQKPPRVDNTGIQGLDLVQTHGPHAGVAYINPSYAHDNDLTRNGYLGNISRLNGNLPHDLDTSYDPEYENEMNRRNANKSNYFNNEKQGDLSFTHNSPRSPTKDKQFLDISDDRDMGPESGYNTQDNPKPKKVKTKDFEAKLHQGNYYFADAVPFAHSPPGHTCGLPCCNRDLHIHLKLSGYPSGCISSMIPFGQPKPEKQDNFSFRQKRAGLLTGKPTFTNRFSSLQTERAVPRRKPLPVFGSLRGTDLTTRQLHELSENQHHYLKERGITLPRMHVGESTTDNENKWVISDDESGSSDSETDYYTIWECNGIDSEVQIKSPNALKSNQMIYPWTLLESVQNKSLNNDKETKEAVPVNFKYGSLPMCYKTIPENEALANVQEEQEPVKQSETKRLMLNFDRSRVLANNKRHTLERTNALAEPNHERAEDIDCGNACRFSTLPRSSVRIRPILKNRVENIYTDLITSSALAEKGRGKLVTWKKNSNDIDDTEEEHNYEQIRDADLIQNWEAKHFSSLKKQTKKLGMDDRPKFHSYENAGFVPDSGIGNNMAKPKVEHEKRIDMGEGSSYKDKANDNVVGERPSGIKPEILNRLKGTGHKELPNNVPITLIL